MAVIVVFVFCWVGLASSRFGELYVGLGLFLPASKYFIIKHGPIGCPAFGFLCAASLVLADLLSINRPLQRSMLIFVVFFVVLVVAACGFVILVSPVFTPGRPIHSQ